jgi:tRNA dimethylallyltransferase
MIASIPTLVLIAGPTASGKSALALRVAEETGGVVVNADSMQVYRDLRIITARPSLDEEARAPHLLYGHVDAAETYSVGRWLGEASAAVADVRAAGRTAIMVGGTGLYFKLATGGLAAIPTIPNSVRTALRTRLESEGVASLHAELAERDAESAARLHPGDRSRIVRALEVLEATGRPLGAWQRENEAPMLDAAAARKVFIGPDRDALRARIDGRFEAMLAAGALEEVRALAARGLDPNLPAMKAHGVPWLIRHLRGEMSRAAAAAEAKADTRRYAKRQFTWFRNQLPDWPWASPESAFETLMRTQRD